MRIYVSSVSRRILEEFTKRWPEEKLDVLRSFALEQDDTTDIALYPPACVNSLILDSGTYTLNNSPELAAKYTVYHYREYLRKYKDKFDFYFNYDLSHADDIMNWDWQRILEEPYPNPIDNSTTKPVPVIQDLKDVEKYCKLKHIYPLVAIGSGANKKKAPLKKAVKELYANGVKVHLFAIGTYDALHDIPVWSSDCTSFLKWASFRRVCFFDHDENREYIIATKENVKDLPYLFDPYKDYADKYGAWLSQRGFDDLFEIDFDSDQDTLMLANLWHYKELAEIITEEHQNVHKFTFDVW